VSAQTCAITVSQNICYNETGIFFNREGCRLLRFVKSAKSQAVLKINGLKLNQTAQV